jgi:hypothetical protein
VYKYIFQPIVRNESYVYLSERNQALFTKINPPFLPSPVNPTGEDLVSGPGVCSPKANIRAETRQKKTDKKFEASLKDEAFFV